MTMNIPGYEWDAAKNRYFKILKTGELPACEYTISALAERSRQGKRKRIAEFEKERRQNMREELPSVRAVGKIGRRAQSVLPSRSQEALTSFVLVPALHDSAEGLKAVSRYAPIVGHRDGVISSVTQTSSSKGRSIVALNYTDTHGIVAAAVDNEFGSVLADSHHHRAEIRGNFVTQMARVSHSTMAVASTKGVCLWPVGEKLNFSPRMKSTRSITSFSDSKLICGSQNGTVDSIDLSSPNTVVRLFEFPNRRAATNVAAVDEHLIVCTGLEDQMVLLDLRIPSRDRTVRRFEYSNWSYITHGLCLSPNASDGGIAVAQENEIRIFDSQGDILKSIPTDKAPSPCLQWTDEGSYFGSRNRLKLLAKQRFLANQSNDKIESLFQELNASE